MTSLQKDRDIDTLARTIYGEARGEGYAGMCAVANVVMNRFELWEHHPHFGTGTIQSTCKAPYQFSCWNKNDPNLDIILHVAFPNPVWVECVTIAKMAVNGDLEDNTDGATFYFAKGSPTPEWAIGEEPCATIGNHIFFRGIA